MIIAKYIQFTTNHPSLNRLVKKECPGKSEKNLQHWKRWTWNQGKRRSWLEWVEKKDLAPEEKKDLARVEKNDLERVEKEDLAIVEKKTWQQWKRRTWQQWKIKPDNSGKEGPGNSGKKKDLATVEKKDLATVEKKDLATVNMNAPPVVVLWWTRAALQPICVDIDVEWLKLTCTDREIWSCETGSFNMTTTYSINLSVGKYYFLCYETKSSRQVRISERKLGFIFRYVSNLCGFQKI